MGYYRKRFAAGPLPAQSVAKHYCTGMCTVVNSWWMCCIFTTFAIQVEKQPSSMSSEQAYETLGLKTGEAYEESKIRKAYFKMAQKYHPDKNPDGREMFEAVNKVTNKNVWSLKWFLLYRYLN